MIRLLDKRGTGRRLFHHPNRTVTDNRTAVILDDALTAVCTVLNY